MKKVRFVKVMWDGIAPAPEDMTIGKVYEVVDTYTSFDGKYKCVTVIDDVGQENELYTGEYEVVR